MTPTPTRGRRAGIWAAVVSAALVLTPLTAVPAVAAPAAVELPDVIPSISGWTGKPGAAFEVRPHMRVVASDEALRGTAEITAAELATVVSGAIAGTHARAGDIDLRLDSSRSDLGDEGYELTVSNRITIVAATPAGVFYGTRTVLQMLTQQTTLPRGSVVDVPAYEERGVTVCACVINISPEWIDRLIEEMGYLKLNTIVMEMKLKVDGYPQTNTWSYYTKDDVRAFVAKAAQYGIDVVPEINSPGHMEIWLENMPEMQLTQPDGTKDEVRMDITQDASYEFYTDLISEYSDVFTSDWWHMGVDEYMLHSGYGNFPQVKQFAQANWGPTATEDDVVAWYVNKVNAFVKSEGKQLRIWNDGVIRDNAFVDFDRDITIEHWNNAASTVAPQTFVDWGHDITNVTNSLYMVRGSYGVNSANLYNTGWTPEKFYNGMVTTGTDKIRGARMSIWPDGGTPAEAEKKLPSRPVDDAWQYLVSDARRCVPRLGDVLQVRLVEVGAALQQRSYQAPLDVVLEVTDAFCPWNEGRWRLSADAEGAACERTEAEPDLALSVRELGAAYLGGVPLSGLAAAGRVRELRPGALARTSTAFGSDVAPWLPHGF